MWESGGWGYCPHRPFATGRENEYDWFPSHALDLLPVDSWTLSSSGLSFP